MAKKSILFVCLGNICRSPLAEGVFRAVLAERGMADDFLIDSAGMGDWHAGQAPDPRAIAVARTHGVDISGQRARMITEEDFARFDLILGMDRKNITELHEIAPDAFRDRIHLFLDFAGSGAREVPDPYFGDAAGFAETYRLIRAASEALAEKLGATASVAHPDGRAAPQPAAARPRQAARPPR
jgi:protein-tyrosine phosphatase